ncbi:MAG TPA: SRPBCC family protein [Candidatus Dormibacteraeota bacterium]|nr:SRPBCC family protein [Candidatus Dormibacteraeota bacterium]
MIVNVCPAATSKAPPERFWDILIKPEAYAEWTDARFVSVAPPGPIRAGSVVQMRAAGFGREWPVRLDITGLDENRRWIDVIARLPFGVDNHEHLTLTETPEGGTLVRFN